MEQVDMAGGLGSTWARHQAPQGHRSATQVALPCHQSMGVALEPITSYHSSQFDQWMRFDAGGFMGPLS